MKRSYQEIINNIGNTYKNFIDISVKEDLSIFNIKLDEFAKVELKLKNVTQDIEERFNEEIKNLSTISFVQVVEVEGGYLISSFIGNKKRREKVTVFCEDIDFDMELYDYSKIEICEDENVDNYRVRLAVREVRNLLEKHALLGDDGLNDMEKDLIKYAMLIALLNSAQFEEVYDAGSICSIYDLFLKYDNKYEKKEFLEEALKAVEFYIDQIEGIEEVKNIIEYYLNIQKELDKNKKNTKSFNFEEFQKDIEKYQDKCYYYKPMYRIYADFSIEIKKACKNFKYEDKIQRTKFSTEIKRYIDDEIIPKLKENGFEGEYPYFIYKDYCKMYMIGFEIYENKVIIKYDDKKVGSKKIKKLLGNIDYKEINPEDLCVYITAECLDREAVDECIEDFIDDLKLHKEIELNEYSGNTNKSDGEGFLNKIFSIFKKNK